MMTVVKEAPTAAPTWREKAADLQREVQRLVDEVSTAQVQYRAALLCADAAAMLDAKRRYLAGHAALTEARAALAVAEAEARVEQAQERLAAWEEQEQADRATGETRVRTLNDLRGSQSLAESVRDARRGVDDAIAMAMQRLR